MRSRHALYPPLLASFLNFTQDLEAETHFPLETTFYKAKPKVQEATPATLLALASWPDEVYWWFGQLC